MKRSHKKEYVFGSKQLKGVVHCCDAIEFLSSLNESSADLIFLDPPFNLGKDYGSPIINDSRSDDLYWNWLQKVLDLSIYLLKPGGAMYIYHIPKWAMKAGVYISEHLDFRHWIAISMKNGFVRGQKLYPAHYALIYFSKGKPNTFSRPRLEPSRCRHCGNLIKDYGGYWKIIEEKGINLSDFWDDLSPVRHKTTKNRKANELPRELYDRIFAMSGVPGGVFLDPFAGGGTSLLCATESQMSFFACDAVESNCDIIDLRMKVHLKASQEHRR